MTLRLLHTADWQIGRAFRSWPADDAVPLAEARFAAVERLAALARDERFDAVVVAGDVFDAQTLAPRSIRRLFNALAGFAGPWVMIPGNHDAALEESVWTHAARLQALPPNLHLALRPGVVELPALRLALLCAPLTQRQTHDDLTAWFDGCATPPGWFRVGVAHGAVQGLLPEAADSPNPIAPDRAERASLDYLALGDWHGTRCIAPRCWYAGTPEPDRFRDNDAGQALEVLLDAPGALPRVVPRPVAAFRWQRRAPALAVPSDLDALLAELAAAGPADVLELVPTGRVDLAGRGRLQDALDAAAARVRLLRADLTGLQVAPTDEDLAALQADGWLGELLAQLRDEAAGAAHAGTAQDALVLLAGLLRERTAPTADAPGERP